MRSTTLLRVCLLASFACTEETASTPPDAGLGDPAPGERDAGAGHIDAERLAQCEVEEPCGATWAQYVEFRTPNNRNVNVPSATCLFDALAARTPGRYVHDAHLTTGAGSMGARHTLVITPDGSALYVRVPYAELMSFAGAPATSVEPAPPGKRCVLAPAAQLEACKAGLLTLPAQDALVEAVPDDTWRCLFGDEDVGDPFSTTDLPWFSSCETESPIACE